MDAIAPLLKADHDAVGDLLNQIKGALRLHRIVDDIC